MELRESVINHILSIEHGGMLRNELVFLLDFAKDKVCIEIGSLVGKSTCALAFQAKEVFCVDCWDSDPEFSFIGDKESQKHYVELFSALDGKTFDLFQKNTKAFSDKIHAVKGDSKVVHENFSDNFFDLVIIDGDHSYEGTMTDFRNFFPKLKIGGHICFHDFGNSGWPGIIDAIRDVIATGKVKLHHQESTLVVFEKVRQ